jgi:stage V sporulation protein R
MDYKELQKWDNKLGKMAKSYGLDWYPIIYEVCDFYDMIGNISYTGMPSHYQHWSFGKTFTV